MLVSHACDSEKGAVGQMNSNVSICWNIILASFAVFRGYNSITGSYTGTIHVGRYRIYRRKRASYSVISSNGYRMVYWSMSWSWLER